jgi:hypothetical protein
MEELQYFKEVERILVDHRAFGDADYIHSQGDLRYERRLDELSVHLPVAGAVRDALGEVDATVPHRVLGDTVVR